MAEGQRLRGRERESFPGAVIPADQRLTQHVYTPYLRVSGGAAAATVRRV